MEKIAKVRLTVTVEIDRVRFAAKVRRLVEKHNIGLGVLAELINDSKASEQRFFWKSESLWEALYERWGKTRMPYYGLQGHLAEDVERILDALTALRIKVNLKDLI